MKKLLSLIVLSLVITGCGAQNETKSNSLNDPSLVFKGDTNNWQIKMFVTDKSSSDQEIQVNYKYVGPIDDLTLFKHLTLSFDGTIKGNKTVNVEKGLSKREYTINEKNTGVKVTKNSNLKANIDMWIPGYEHKYSTKLILNPSGDK